MPTLREIDSVHATEILGYAPQARGETLTGRLLVAPVKIGDALSTVELIDEAGRKSAVAGGAKRGGFWAAQPLPEGPGEGLTLLIAEGIATALSARLATEHPAAAALSCGNLAAVARAMRERYPAAAIVILADLGKGEDAADGAARECGGSVARPDFGTDRQPNQTDMNDLAKDRGPESVRECIAAAIPGPQENENPNDGLDVPAKIRSHRKANIAARYRCKPFPSCLPNRARSGLSGAFFRGVRWASVMASPVRARLSSSWISRRPLPEDNPGSVTA